MVHRLGPMDVTALLSGPGIVACILPLLALGPTEVGDHLRRLIGAAFPLEGTWAHTRLACAPQLC